MNASSLDTLEKSQLPLNQARAILQVMDSERAIHDTALATKAELFELKSSLELKIEGLRTEMHCMRADLVGEIRGTVRWNFAFWATSLAMTVGILKLLK